MAVMDYSLVQRIIDGTGQILDTTPGSPDSGSYVTEAQLRDWIKAGILFSGYYYNGNFYSDSGHTSPLAKVEGALYVDKTNSNKALYVCLSSTYQSLTEEAQVQAIIDGLNDGTIVPLKAKQDQNGNVIDTTYETKADANDLKNALQATNKRVTNLEQKAGDEIVVDYPSSTYGMDEVPANVAEYAKVTKLRGVTRVWNQLVNSYRENASYAGITLTNHSTYITLSGTSNAQDSMTTNYFTGSKSGHVYLVAMFGVTSADCGIFAGTTTSSYGEHAVLHTGIFSTFGITFKNNVAINATVNCVVRDLTQYFSSDPSVDVSTLTISDIQSDYPELLIPSDFDAGSLVSTEYSGIESVGRNRLKPSYFKARLIELGGTDNGDGTVSIGANLINGHLIWENDLNEDIFSFVIAGSNQYNLANLKITYTDETTESLYLSASGTWKTSSNSKRVKNLIGTWDSGTTTFDIAKCGILSGSTSTFQEYMESTLSLPSPVELRSAGSVADTLELNVEVNGEAKRRTTVKIGEVDMGNIIISYNSTREYFYCNTLDILPIGAESNSRIVCAYYQVIDKQYTGGMATTPNMTICQAADASGTTNYILIKDTSKTDADIVNYKAPWLTGYKMYYALLEETVTLSEPILDPFLKVEGGGTIRPIQTQTTEIDSAMTAEYLSLGA